METKETKKIKNYVDHTLGFPVKLGEVTFVRFRDDWAAKINYNAMMLKVLGLLSHLARPLTGAEVRFVRQYFSLTLTDFAAKFGVSHVAVHKWEKHRQQPTGMQWSTEKDLRLFIQSQLSKDPKAIGLLYHELDAKPVIPKGLSKFPALVAA
jgi:DNA-binding transcriptional regulator YiaG